MLLPDGNSISDTERVGRKFLRPIFFSLVILCSACAVGLCDITDDYLRKGVDMLKQKRYLEAIVYFQAAHSAEPENKGVSLYLSNSYQHLANEYAAQSDWYKAIKSQEQALEHEPGNQTIRRQLAVYYNNHALKMLDQQKYEAARRGLEDALETDPDSQEIRRNLYNCMLNEAEYLSKQKNSLGALDNARDAIALLPDSDSAYIFAGNIYYNQDDFDQALENWEKALKIKPDNAILAERIEKLKREKSVESGFKTRQKQHFRIRYERDTDSEYVWTVSDMLNEARRLIGRDFGLYSDEVIPVIIYTKEQFDQATNQSDWTLGLYDGKIRLRESDITASEEVLRRILYHEYAHAVLNLNYGSDIPTWVHEGFAQYNEPQQDSGERGLSKQEKDFLRWYLDRHESLPIEDIEALFTYKSDPDVMRLAYVQSKVAMLYLLDYHRVYYMKRFFQELGSKVPWQQAVTKVFHKNIDRLKQDINDYARYLLE